MTAPAATLATSLGLEWERLALLGRCLSESRQGQDIPDERIERLRGLQSDVIEARATAETWRIVPSVELSPIECDIVACSVGPEAEPGLGLMFQSLQPGAPQPYPTVALVQELFALDPTHVQQLYTALAPRAPLRSHRLIRLESAEPFEPIRPGAGVVARVTGREESERAPVGALRVRLPVGWDDLVLPAAKVAQLEEFLLWIRHRDKVVDVWRGRDCGGPVALFAGPSGTGKTLAAAVIANELGWPLWRVDLGRIVSKYVGETEQNLNELFEFAHDRQVVLVFDEADALFSKRGEVKEARDRYANMEVSHLLSRIEAHRGPCILTTNLRANLDVAFTRRFHVVVGFSSPDAAARERLWRLHLPPGAPLDAALDPAFLARAVNLTGGSIRNAALHAAYLAAGADAAIGLPQCSLAVWRELSKEGRNVSTKDIGPLRPHLPEDIE